MSATEKSKSGGCRRVILWALLLPTILVAAIAALLNTGIPQRHLLRQILTSQLQAHVDVGEVSLQNPLSIQSLVLTDAASSLYAPLLRIENIAAAYRWQPDAPRHIESVTMTGVQVSLQGEGERSNFQFVRDLLAAPSNSTLDLSPWLPEQLRVEDLWAEARFPGYYLRMDNIAASAALYQLEAGTLSIGSDNVALAWESILTPGGPQSHVGAVHIDLGWQGTDMDAKAQIDFGRLAQLDGTFAVSTREGAPYIDVSVPSLRLDDPLWSAMLLEHLSLPVFFDSLTLSDVQLGLHLRESGIRVDAAELEGDVPAIRIGPPEAPYYQGPLQVVLHGNYGESTALAGSVTLDDGLGLSGRVVLDADGLSGEFDVPPWPRDTIAALLPESYASVLTLFKPLEKLAASGTVRQRSEELELVANLKPQFSDIASVSLPVTLMLSSDQAGDKLNVTTKISLGKASLASTVDGIVGGSLKATNTLHEISINTWTKAFLGEELLPELGGVFSGELVVSTATDGPLVVDGDLKGVGFRYGEFVLPETPPVKIAGSLRYESDSRMIHGKKLEFAQDEVIDLSARDWHVDLNTSAVTAAMKGSLSLDALGSIVGLEELYGTARISGALSIDASRVHLDEATAQFEDLLYGDWGMPYGDILGLEGSLTCDLAAKALSFSPVMIQAGEGARLSASTLDIQFPNGATLFQMTATPFVLESDLSLLERMGYLNAVEGGRAKVSADRLVLSQGGVAGRIAWDISAARLSLSDDMAVLENLATTGNYNSGSVENGEGRIMADSVFVYGVPFGGVDTELKIDATQLACSDLTTTFLAGNLVLDVTVNYRDPAWATSADLRVTGVDLAEFTKTFAPPDVVLTGIVSGTASVALSTEKLTALDVDLTATDNLTLNRAMVREILMSQYVNGTVGSKMVQKILEKVVGKVEQRPFDKAIVDLRLEDGVIVGFARLESKTLDLTVDVNADPSALLQAIRESMDMPG